MKCSRGKRAFRGANRTATMAALLKEEPEPPSKVAPDLPREVERVVARCLRKDLDRRSQSMAEIRVALQDLKEESESGSLSAASALAPAARSARRWPYYAAGVVDGRGWDRGNLVTRAGRPAPVLHPAVLTSFVGNQFAPSLSPDGNQFAFAWDGDVHQGPPHVYISLVGKGTPLRLTPENEALEPSWSPDGQSIAFFRGRPAPDRELLVMPALGGPSRRIATGPAWPRVRSLWSPDGKWLLWSEISIRRGSLRVSRGKRRRSAQSARLHLRMG